MKVQAWDVAHWWSACKAQVRRSKGFTNRPETKARGQWFTIKSEAYHLFL